MPDFKNAFDLRRAVGSLKSKSAQVQAVLIGLSGLKEDFRRYRFAQLAAEVFEPLRLAAPGNVEIFVPESLDVLVVGRNLPRAEIRDSVLRIGEMFSADPLLEGGGPRGMARIARWFDLENPDHFKQFEAAVSDISDRSMDANRKKISGQVEDQPLTPKRLFLVQEDAERLLLGPMLRRETLIGIGRDNQARQVAEVLRINESRFRKIVAEDVDFASDPWLSMDLHRVIGPLTLPIFEKIQACKNFEGLDVRLNMETIETQAFAGFRAALGDSCRVLVTINPSDAFADMAKAHRIRDRLTDLNCISVLGPCSPQSLLVADPGVVGTDLVRLTWSQELQLGLDAGLPELMDSLGRDRLILAACDGPAAMAWGHGQGMQYFQGPHIDYVLGRQPGTVCPDADGCVHELCPTIKPKPGRERR